MFDIKNTIMSQYANSPRLLSIIELINDAVDPSKNLADFYNIVLNLKAAQGFGLDIWGRIVGVNRNVKMVDSSLETFGFKTTPQEPKFTPFNVAPFSGEGTNFSTYALPDNQFRELILIKAAANILYATAPNINRYLRSIFGEQVAYYKITGHMTANYCFEFDLTPFQRLIIFDLKLLPEPCGVKVSYINVQKGDFFGFDGSNYQPFDVGVFYQ